ncbi:glucosaminidase domain-containing protein [Terrimonas alba]|uniref:glucosaminidase domain-containing protein n=1 Tax=Terrimonas alba TaxID=3349636 RepID=UPI0035F4A724
MQNIRFLFSFVFLMACLVSNAQNPDIIRNYINTYRETAIAEMQRTGVPAAIKLAQGIHETTAGTSDLVRRSNNHFGIKCKSNWTGESVKHTDDAPHECFRKYDDPAQSYRDHSDFLRGSSRYASLFALDPLDYEGWAYGLKKAGYATNPRYPQIIIKLIETYQLQDYTLIAMGKMSPKEDMIAQSDGGEKHGDGVTTASAVTRPVRRMKQAIDYPSGEFKINETKVIYALAGTPVLAIADRYNISLSKIFEFNDLDESETIQNDQLIYLQRKRKTGNNEFHIVAEGETIQDIAREEAIRMESLLEYNHLKSHMQPAVGEQLYLRKKAPAMPRLAKNEI